MARHRVLLLSPPGEAEDLAFLLEDEGHAVLRLPGRAPHAGLRAAAEGIHRFKWIAATGGEAVRELLAAAGVARTRGQLQGARWLVPGGEALAAVERRGLVAQACAPGDLGGSLGAVVESHDEVLVLAEAGEPLDELRAAADAAGAQVVALELSPLPPVPPEWLEAGPAAVLVPSTVAAEQLVARVPQPLRSRLLVVAGGASVAAVLEGAGVQVGRTAASAEPGALVDALAGVLAPSA